MDIRMGGLENGWIDGLADGGWVVERKECRKDGYREEWIYGWELKVPNSVHS